MAPLVGDGDTRAPGASPRVVNEVEYRPCVSERDDGFVESCGQDDEGIGHIVTMFDGEQSDIAHEMYAEYISSRCSLTLE